MPYLRRSAIELFQTFLKHRRQSNSVKDKRRQLLRAIISVGAPDKPDQTIYVVFKPLLLKAGCPIDRCSTTGLFVFLWYILFFPGRAKSRALSPNPVQRQNTGLCLQPLVKWLRRLLFDLGIHLTAARPLHCDNNGAIQIETNPVFNERTNNQRSGLTHLGRFTREKCLDSKTALYFVRPSDCIFLNQVSHSCSAWILFGLGKLSLLDLSIFRVLGGV